MFIYKIPLHNQMRKKSVNSYFGKLVGLAAYLFGDLDMGEIGYDI